MTDKGRSAIDFVRHNESGLEEFHRLDATLAILSTLIAEGMSLEGVVARILHSPFARKLLEIFRDAYLPGRQATEFGLAVYRNRHNPPRRHREEFGFAFEMQEVMSVIFRHPVVFAELVKQLTREELMDAVGVYFYWQKRIEHFIATGDLDRAWDEFLKSQKGEYALDSPSSMTLIPDFVQAVGEEKLKQAPSRHAPAGSHIRELLEKRSIQAMFDKSAPGRDLELLYNYFTARKAERRRARIERKLRAYEEKGV